MKIIPDIETLKEVVKVNASFPFESISIYIDDARDNYIRPFLGDELLAKVEAEEYPELLPYLRRAIGPLAVMLCIPENAIVVGDSGITVQNDQGKRSVASDAKIASAMENLYARGYNGIDRLLNFIDKNSANYAEMKAWKYQDSLVRSVSEFESISHILIGGSAVNFSFLYTALVMSSYEINQIIGNTLSQRLFQILDSNAVTTAAENRLLISCQKFVCAMARASYSRTVVNKYLPTELRPLFPLGFYVDEEYSRQAVMMERCRIMAVLCDNYEALGIASPISEGIYKSINGKMVGTL